MDKVKALESSADPSIGGTAIWKNAPIMCVQIFEPALSECLGVFISDALTESTATTNFKALAQYYNKIHSIQISPDELQAFLNEVYISTRIKVAKNYLEKNIVALIEQTLGAYIDESKLAINDDIISDSQQQVSALVSDIDTALIKPYAKQTKKRLSEWGKPSRGLSIRYLIERVLPAYEYCYSNVCILRRLKNAPVKQSDLKMYEFIMKHPEQKPTILACMLMLKYPPISDSFKLNETYQGEADAESLYNAIKKAKPQEEKILKLLRERGL